MDRNEVHIAFEILLEEIETVVGSLDDEGAAAFQAHAYDRAVKLARDATRLAEFHAKVKSLQAEWQTLFAETKPPKPKAKGTDTRKDLGRLRKGLRTPEDAFRKPILEALMELGGRAHRKKVLDLVGKKMKGTLNKHDRERLPSAPVHEIRWRKTANWCRYVLVQEGLMESDSPRGVWEISGKGRKALEKLRWAESEKTQ